MNADFDNAITAILQESMDAVASTHGGRMPAESVMLSLCTRIYLLQKKDADRTEALGAIQNMARCELSDARHFLGKIEAVAAAKLK